MRLFLISFVLIISFLPVMAQPVKKTMKRLPDTGQNTSYTATFGEDSDYSFNAPFFTLNGNGTVTDTVTGLMWQSTDGGEMTIESARIYCDTLSLAGYTDWRLPDCHELFSILNHDRTNPAIDIRYFTNTSAEYWWSSETQMNDAAKVWVTNSGGGVGNHPKSETISAGGTKRFHVRAVRDVQTPSQVQSRYTNNNDGTISDQLTGLIWKQSPYTDSLSWENALLNAESLIYAGYSDWRLPNIKELQSLNDESLMNPSISPVFTNMNSGKYWSSTSMPNQTTKAWYWDNQFGITTYAVKTQRLNVIYVRNGNSITTGMIGDFEKPEIKVLTFPNPSNGKLKIQALKKIEAITVINILGEVIAEYYPFVKSFELDLLQTGIYFLSIQSGKQSVMIKQVNQ